MTPSMNKPVQTSVRDKIAAFEKNSSVLENAVIRARYIPDVKGVNRYKHFHTPIPPEEKKTVAMFNRFAANTLPVLAPGKMLFISPAGDGYEENGVEKVPRKNSKKDRLPQLTLISPKNKKQREKDIADYIEEQAKQALHPSDSSDSSIRTRPSARRLAAIQPERRTFAELGMRQNGVIINRNRQVKTTSYLEAPLPPRSQSARDVLNTSSESDVAETPRTPTGKPDTATKDMATQTIKAQHSTRSVEILEPVGNTDEEIEAAFLEIYKKEHQAMFSAISQALDSTIDKHSRERTELAIIHAAKKQARVWRDAKDFIANQLVPQSIEMANRSKTAHRPAIEILANMKCYP